MRAGRVAAVRAATLGSNAADVILPDREPDDRGAAQAMIAGVFCGPRFGGGGCTDRTTSPAAAAPSPASVQMPGPLLQGW
jgi:hypothetical protein